MYLLYSSGYSFLKYLWLRSDISVSDENIPLAAWLICRFEMKNESWSSFSVRQYLNKSGIKLDATPTVLR